MNDTLVADCLYWRWLTPLVGRLTLSFSSLRFERRTILRKYKLVHDVPVEGLRIAEARSTWTQFAYYPFHRVLRVWLRAPGAHLDYQLSDVSRWVDTVNAAIERTTPAPQTDDRQPTTDD